MEKDDETTTRIRKLNDTLRCTSQGGTILITSGIAALDTRVVARIGAAVAAFDAFTEDNDPYGEHDCAALMVDGIKLVWKIDYYDLDREFHSPDAADTKVTARVLTIMRADEY